jgi:hypothetical protein
MQDFLLILCYAASIAIKCDQAVIRQDDEHLQIFATMQKEERK